MNDEMHRMPFVVKYCSLMTPLMIALAVKRIDAKNETKIQTLLLFCCGTGCVFSDASPFLKLSSELTSAVGADSVLIAN